MLKALVRPVAKGLGARLLWRLAMWVNERRYEHACAEARNLLTKYLPRAAETMAKQRADGGLGHRYSEYKLLELGWHLEQLRPETVLELGSGSTTAVFAEYAAAKPGAVVVSLEESKEFMLKTLERLAEPLRDWVTICHCPRQVDVLDGTEVCYYATDYRQRLPDDVIDLVYVDGPSCESPTAAGRLMPCVDIVHLLEANYTVKNILFDYRVQSIHYLRAGRFGLLYDASLHPSAVRPEDDLWPVYKTRHHSWLRRRKEGLLLQYPSLLE